MHSGGGLYAGGRVPPPHPFLRSSSVPEQYDPFLEEDGLIPSAATPTPAAAAGDPYAHHWAAAAGGGWPSSRGSYLRGSGNSNLFNNGSSPSPSSVSSPWRSTSYLERPARTSVAHRLGRQLSVSTDIPVGPERGLYGQHHHTGHYLPTHQSPSTPSSVGASGHPSAVPTSHLPPSATSRQHNHQGASSSFGGTLSSRSPLTLGRSLQLVTSGTSASAAAAAASAAAAGIPGDPNDPSSFRRKKTVRFNSLDSWGHNAAPGGTAASAAAGNPGVAASAPYDCDYEDSELWMTIEDVRSGRWARWDSLRQESQESQTRDSGIETGSCFTSSEDSNRGDHINKKVKGPM